MSAPVLDIGTLKGLITLDDQFTSKMIVVERQLTDAGKKLDKIGAASTAVGKAMLPITLAIGAVGLGSIKLATDFESSFSGVRKTVEATEAEFADMEKGLRGLAKQIPINVNDFNRLAEAAGALGIPKKEIVDFSRVMGLLGVTTNVTADQAAESISKIQNIFNAAGKETEAFASTLVALGNDGASTESDILSMASRIAGAGNTIGLTQGQVLAFASTLSGLGIEAEMGGSAISKVFVEIAGAVSRGGEQLDNFAKLSGKSVDDFKRLFKEDAAGAVNEFISGLGRIKNGGGDLIGTMDQLGFTETRLSDTLRRLAGSGDQLSNALAKQAVAWKEQSALQTEADKKFETTAAQAQILWQKITDVGITLGKTLLPAVKATIAVVDTLVPYLESAVMAFSKLPTAVQMGIGAFAVMLAAVAPILIVFGKIASGVGALIPLFPAVAVGIRSIGVALAGLALNPVVLGITLLAGAALVLYTRLNNLKTKVAEFNDAIKEQKRLTDAATNVVGAAMAASIDWTKLTDEQKVKLLELSKEVNTSEISFSRWGVQLNVATGAAARTVPVLAAMTDEQKEQIEAMRRLTSSGSTLSKVNYDLIANYLSMGKAEADIAKAYGFTAQQVDDVAAAEKALVTNREHLRAVTTAALEAEAQRAAELMNRYAEGWKQNADLDKAFRDQQAQRSLSTLNLELYNIQQWVDEQLDGYKGAADGAEAFYRKIQGFAKVKRQTAVVDDVMQQIAARSKATIEGIAQITNAETELANLTTGLRVSSHNAEILRIHEWAREQKAGFKGTQEQVEQFYNTIDKIAQTKIAAMSKSWRTFFSKDLPSAILSAVQGGGNIGDTIGTMFGTQIGEKLSTSLGDKISKSGEIVKGPLTKMLGATVGGAITAMLPGVGALLGSLAGKLVDKVVGLFTGGEGAKANDLRDSLKKQLMQTVAGIANDPSIAAALRRFNTAGTTQGVQDAFDDVMAQADLASAAMDRYGLSLDDTGSRLDKFRRNLNQAVSDFGRLGAIGFSVTQITNGAVEQLNGLISSALETGERLPESLRPFLYELARSGQITEEVAAQLLGLSATGTPSLDQVREAAERYGLTLDQLGPKVRQLEITETATQIAKDFELLNLAGADMGAVFEASSKQVQDLVNDALRYGMELPESLRPWIEQMALTGDLVDLNGDKLEDLSGINFVKPMSQMVDELIAKLDDLVDALMGVGNTRIPPVIVPVEVQYNDNGYRPDGTIDPNGQYGYQTDTPQLRGGTLGAFPDWGEGTLVELHGRERVMTMGEQERSGGNVIMVDGEVLASVTSRRQPGDFRTRGF